MAQNSHQINVPLLIQKAYCTLPLCECLQSTETNTLENKHLVLSLKEFVIGGADNESNIFDAIEKY